MKYSKFCLLTSHGWLELIGENKNKSSTRLALKLPYKPWLKRKLIYEWSFLDFAARSDLLLKEISRAQAVAILIQAVHKFPDE